MEAQGPESKDGCVPNSDSRLRLRQALLALQVPLEDLYFPADGGFIDNKENNSGSSKDGQARLQRDKHPRESS